MPHAVTLSLAGGFDDLAALEIELDSETDLRGRVRMISPETPPGALGGVLPQLLVTLGSGGLATALASVIVVWLKQRTGSVAVRLTRPDGSQFELTAERVRALDNEALRTQVDQFAALIWSDRPPDDGD